MPSPLSRRPSPPPTWPTSRYGNKTANLESLAQILGNAARVPAFTALDHDAVTAFLGPRFEIAKATLDLSLREHLDAGGEALTPTLTKRLAAVRETIDKAFEDACPCALLLSVQPWLTERPHARLVVRSSGAEDSDTVVNAGGNQSVVNVANDERAIRAALVTVLQSYFSERSYQQRMLAADDFEGGPTLAVLLQEMVGETAGRHPPSSGVLFTTEAEAFTPGIAHVQSTFGHNDAVVQSLLPVDSFYLDAESTHAIVRHKPTRLVPAPRGGLCRQDNPAALRMKPALSAPTLRRLREIGAKVASHYQQPMDIEWTFDADQDELYVLQARPLLQQDTGEPSSLSPEALLHADLFAGTLVGAGGGSVRLLSNRDEVIVAATLVEAVQKFLQRRTEGSATSLVVVADRAEPTSHEATLFRGAQIPVLQARDLEAARSFVNRDIPFLFDASLAALARGPHLVKDDGIAPGVIVHGWRRHPTLARRSVLETAPYGPDFPAFLRELAVNAGFTEEEALDPLATFSRLLERTPEGSRRNRPHEWIEALRAATQPAQRADAALELLAQAARITASLQNEPALASRATRLWQQIASQTQSAMKASAQSSSLRFLFSLTSLEALTAQRPGDGVIAADSLVGLLAERRELRALKSLGTSFIDELSDEQSAAFALATGRFGQMAWTPQVAAAFARTTQNIARTTAGRTVLASLLGHVHHAGISALWVNLTFGEKSPLHALKSPAKQLAFLTKSFAANEKVGVLRDATRMREIAQQWQHKQLLWEQPSALADLQSQFLAEAKFWLEETGPELFARGTSIEKAMSLASLSQWIDAVDVTLKTLSASPAHSAEQKALAVRSLLQLWAVSLVKWLDVAAPTFAAQQTGYKTNTEAAQRWVKELQKNFSLATPPGSLYSRLQMDNVTLPTSEALLPSKDFNVRAAQLGSGTETQAFAPKTLDDYFTTLHQSFLQVVAAGYVEAGLTVEHLPASLHMFVQSLARSARAGETQPQIVGIHPEAHGVTVDVNWALREHGIRIQFHQLQAQGSRLRADVSYFSRENENFRLYRAMLGAGFVAAARQIPFVDNAWPTWDAQRHEVRWSWDLDVGDTKAEEQGKFLQNFLHHLHTDSTLLNTHVSLRDQLRSLQSLMPSVRFGKVIEKLPESFFVSMPWYNDEFLALFAAENRLRTPAFARLASAIRQQPAGQDALWSHSFFAKIKESTEPKAIALLEALMESDRATRTGKKSRVPSGATLARKTSESLPKSIANVTHAVASMLPLHPKARE